MVVRKSVGRSMFAEICWKLACWAWFWAWQFISGDTESTCFYPQMTMTGVSTQSVLVFIWLCTRCKVYLFLSINVYDRSLDTESTCFNQLICMTGLWTQSVLVFILILKFKWGQRYEIVSAFKTRKKFSLSFNSDQFPEEYPEKCIMWLTLHQ